MTKRTKKLWGRKDCEPIIEEYLVKPTRTYREFTEARGLELRTFRRWLYELGGSRAGTAVELAGFVEVELSAAPAPPVRVCVGDVSVEFDTLPPPAWVGEMIFLASKLGNPGPRLRHSFLRWWRC